MRTTILLLGLTTLLGIPGCKEKKQTDDIIAPKVVEKKPTAPIRMQPYDKTDQVQWLGKTYSVEVKRTPDDSLRMVKDESGQKYIDNHISLRIIRADGSVFFRRVFTKAAFDAYLTDQYRRQGILEGLVFDKTDGNTLKLAASVCLPQSDDEYIPLEVTVDNFGNVSMARDNSLDTYGDTGGDDED